MKKQKDLAMLYMGTIFVPYKGGCIEAKIVVELLNGYIIVRKLTTYYT